MSSFGELKDYKIFCFDGKPKFIQVDFDRFSDHKRNIYDLEWNLINLSIKYPNDPAKVISKPSNIDSMIDIAKQLSEGFPEIRVDLYSVCGRTFFGELTLFHGSGFEKFSPISFEELFGSYIHLK